MLSSLTAFTILNAALVQALHLPTPPNGYLGDLHTTITCQALGLNLTFDALFAATGPLVIESGQKAFANDVAGNLTVPAYLGGLAGLVGVDHIDTLIHVELQLENLTPEEFNPIPNGLWVNGTKLASSGDSRIQFPKEGVIGGFGPITGGSAGSPGLVYLGDVSASLYLYDKNNKLILPITATCGVPEYNALLASFSIVEATSANPPDLSPANGYLIDWPVIESNTQYGCFDFQYSCTVGAYGTYDLGVATCGTAGAIYEVGSQFTVPDIVSLITIPEDLVGGLRGLFPNVTQFDFDARSLFLELTNASPSSANGVPDGGISQTISVPQNGTLSFLLPATGDLTFGPFTVLDKVGDVVGLYVGNSTSHTVYKDASGNMLGEADIFCVTKVPNLETIGVTIAPQGALSKDGETGI